jgi:GTP 3',8-cyclase
VTVSLDALDDKVFRQISDVDLPLSRILAGVEAAMGVGLAPVKVNTVVERGVNVNQILPIARRFRGTGIVVRFIEYMDVGGASLWSNSKVFTSDETRAIIESAFPLVAVAPRLPYATHGTALRYRYADGQGEVGFISSMSKPFCGSCSRARVSADGHMYTCLFATTGMDLRPWLSDAASVAQLADTVRARWSRRDDRYSELRATKRRQGSGKAYPVVRMSLVGG